MEGQRIEVIERMHDNQVIDWEALRAQAAAAGVGGWRWEEAWLAAGAGRRAGTVVFCEARSRGADELSAAALAGIVAAHRARAALTDEQFRVLIETVTPHPRTPQALAWH
jgi:hypothetical protein